MCSEEGGAEGTGEEEQEEIKEQEEQEVKVQAVKCAAGHSKY